MGHVRLSLAYAVGIYCNSHQQCGVLGKTRFNRPAGLVDTQPTSNHPTCNYVECVSLYIYMI